MSESAAKLLENRIAAIVARVRMLAAERDALSREIESMKSRAEVSEKDNVRLRAALEQAAHELSQE